MLKVIFFDAFGTLIYLPRPVGEHYSDMAARFGVSLNAVSLDQAFRFAWAHSPPRAASRLPRPDEDKSWWRDLVDRVLTAVLSPAERARFDYAGYFEAVYARFAEPGVWAAYPEVCETLAQLRRRGLALAIVSNFDRRLYTIFEHLRLSVFFEQIVISSEVGADKPDPYIFQRALEIMQVGPAEAIHVGDDPKCDWGAEAIGLRVLRLERPRMTLRDLLAMLDEHAAM